VALIAAAMRPLASRTAAEIATMPRGNRLLAELLSLMP